MSPETRTNTDLSLIEQLDPRVKFFSFMLLAIQIFVLRSETSLAVPSILLMVATVASRIPVVLLLKRLLSISVFILLIITVNMFTISGDVLFEFMGMYATTEGLRLGALLSARIMLLLIAATIFVRTTSVLAMIDGIEATLRPTRKRLGAIIQVLAIALTFVPMLVQSAQQIKKAQIARGADPDRNVVRQLRFALSAALPLFAMTLRSSEHLALAMEARGYDPLAERTHYGELHTTPQDWSTLLLILTQFVVSLAVGG